MIKVNEVKGLGRTEGKRNEIARLKMIRKKERKKEMERGKGKKNREREMMANEYEFLKTIKRETIESIRKKRRKQSKRENNEGK